MKGEMTLKFDTKRIRAALSLCASRLLGEARIGMILGFISGLRARLLLLVLVAALPALALTLEMASLWRGYEVRGMSMEALGSARLVAASHERLLDAAREGVLALTRVPLERFSDPATCGAHLATYWPESVLYKRLGVIGTDGRLLCAIPAGDAGAVSSRDADVRPATMTCSFTAAEDQGNAATGRCTIEFAQPVLDRAQPSRPVVFAALDLARLGKAVTGAELPGGTTVTLIDREGTILARQPDAERWVGKSALTVPLFRTVAEQRDEGILQAADVDGVSRLFAFRRLASFPPDTKVAVGIAPDIAFAGAKRIISLSLIGVGLAAALALASAWIGTDVLLLGRLQTLLGTAHRLRLGDLSARTGISSGRGELRELARAFDEMAATVQTREAEREQARQALNAVRDELESRVTKRTADLVGANEALQAALAERQRSEEARRKLSSAVEQAGDSVVITDHDGIIEYVNPAFERLTGYAAREVVGENTRLLKSGVHEEEFYRGLWRTITSGQVFRAAFVNRKRDGSLYYEEKTITPLRDPQGEITHFVSAGRDITEREVAEEELRNSREQLRAFAAHLESVREDERSRMAREIHDELGHALTSLRFDICRLAAAPPDDRATLPEATKAMTALIDRTIESIRRIARELRPGVLDDFGLVAAIEWQAEEVQARTGIRCRFTASPPEIEVNRHLSTAVFRILQETLTNVARHAKATSVDIALKLAGATLTLTVRDNGRGITTTELSDRRSLGLLGMRERALLLGGQVLIVGRPGKGTAVMLEVPVGQPVRAGGPTTPSPMTVTS